MVMHHLGAQVLVVIGRRNRKIAFLVARPISEIVFHPPGIPAALFCVDEVEAVVLALIEAHIVENEELRFGAEVSRVGQARCARYISAFARCSADRGRSAAWSPDR